MEPITKKIFGLLISALLFGTYHATSAQSIPINTYLFYGEGCPHCVEEEQYLFNVLKPEYPNLQIYKYEVYYNRENGFLLQKIAKELNIPVDGVPFLVVGNKPFIGYSGNITPQAIEQRVSECSLQKCPDSIASIAGLSISGPEEQPQTDSTTVPISTTSESQNAEQSTEKKIKLPILGEINALSFSLPILTIVMGALDGFNPCALWTLLFLISLLLGMKNRKRMWLLGTAFIVASASVYFLFMAAWLNLVLFLGFVVWIRILIGALALFGAGYSLKEFFTNKEAACKITGEEKRRITFEKIKLVVQERAIWLALGGIVILAFAVNLVELVCSAGLPAVYTQILALNELASWQYYLYILLYILFFMLDDLFIFFAAMFTLEATGITTKYVRASRLIGGLVMLAIGSMLIFKPEWLMFG